MQLCRCLLVLPYRYGPLGHASANAYGISLNGEREEDSKLIADT